MYFVPRFKNGNGDGVCIGGQRPGLAQPTIVPAQLNQQNNASAPQVTLTEQPQGKTSSGGTQWGVVVSQNGKAKLHRKHPGLAKPNMVAKADGDKSKVDNAPDAPPTLSSWF